MNTQRTYVKLSGGEHGSAWAISLSDYMSMGGIFDDGGNGGERVDPVEFLLAVHPAEGVDTLEVLRVLNIEDYWMDSLLDCALVRKYGDLPLEVETVTGPLTPSELRHVHAAWVEMDTEVVVEEWAKYFETEKREGKTNNAS